MKKLNCWEYKKCGRHPDNENVDDLGVCPATVASDCQGINYGKYGGRFCWHIAGTLCGGTVQGAYAIKFMNCIECDFFKLVQDEESHEFVMTPNDAKKV